MSYQNFIKQNISGGVLPPPPNMIRVKPSAKTVLTPLGLTVAALTTDVAIQKKIYDSGTTLIWKKISWKYLNLLKNLLYW